MRGSPVNQAQVVFHQSGIKAIGASKHKAVVHLRSQGITDKHEIAQRTGIYSYNTANFYRGVWIDCLKETRENFGMRDVEQMKGEHIQAFLQGKVDKGVAKATLQNYAGACEKLGVALNMYAGKTESGRTYDFSGHIAEVRSAGRNLEHKDQSRAYENPKELIANIKNPDFQLAATLQYVLGARVYEVAKITTGQLKENTLTYQSKGGKMLHRELPSALAGKLQDRMNRSGNFQVDKREYRNSLQKAADRTIQAYQGTHGLRWNYAQEKFMEYQREGATYEQALSMVSHDLGHNRADITEHYLR